MVMKMGVSSFNPFSLLLLLSLAFFSIFTLIPPAQSGSDYTSLVYKGCAKQALSDPTGVYTQALSALFGSLVSQSTKARFYKTSSGSGQSTINGLFQCRGDLSNGDCYNCVSKIPQIVESLCGKTIAARVQLYGCYLLYEVSGFAQISGFEMLYKTCGSTNVAGSGFEERRDTALSVLENGVVSGHGFYATNYQSVYVLGQCEGDLGDSDCGECVKNAVQRAQVECGSSISGQLYLHRCFISYSYYPNGVPTRSSSSSSSSSSSGKAPKAESEMMNTETSPPRPALFVSFLQQLLLQFERYFFNPSSSPTFAGWKPLIQPPIKPTVLRLHAVSPSIFGSTLKKDTFLGLLHITRRFYPW